MVAQGMSVTFSATFSNKYSKYSCKASYSRFNQGDKHQRQKILLRETFIQEAEDILPVNDSYAAKIIIIPLEGKKRPFLWYVTSYLLLWNLKSNSIKVMSHEPYNLQYFASNTIVGKIANNLGCFPSPYSLSLHYQAAQNSLKV